MPKTSFHPRVMDTFSLILLSKRTVNDTHNHPGPLPGLHVLFSVLKLKIHPVAV